MGFEPATEYRLIDWLILRTSSIRTRCIINRVGLFGRGVNTLGCSLLVSRHYVTGLFVFYRCKRLAIIKTSGKTGFVDITYSNDKICDRWPCILITWLVTSPPRILPVMHRTATGRYRIDVPAPELILKANARRSRNLPNAFGLTLYETSSERRIDCPTTARGIWAQAYHIYRAKLRYCCNFYCYPLSAAPNIISLVQRQHPQTSGGYEWGMEKVVVQNTIKAVISLHVSQIERKLLLTIWLPIVTWGHTMYRFLLKYRTLNDLQVRFTFGQGVEKGRPSSNSFRGPT